VLVFRDRAVDYYILLVWDESVKIHEAQNQCCILLTVTKRGRVLRRYFTTIVWENIRLCGGTVTDIFNRCDVSSYITISLNKNRNRSIQWWHVLEV
jgi:hypothetical protein